MHALATQVSRDVKVALMQRRLVNPRLGVGSILLLDFSEFGADAKNGSGQGVYLRVECSWRIALDDMVLIACEDSRERLQECVKVLEGREVRDVEVSVPALELRLSLEGNCRICAFPVYADDSEYENWTVHTPTGEALVAGPGREVQRLPIGA